MLNKSFRALKCPLTLQATGMKVQGINKNSCVFKVKNSQAFFFGALGFLLRVSVFLSRSGREARFFGVGCSAIACIDTVGFNLT